MAHWIPAVSAAKGDRYLMRPLASDAPLHSPNIDCATDKNWRRRSVSALKTPQLTLDADHRSVTDSDSIHRWAQTTLRLKQPITVPSPHSSVAGWIVGQGPKLPPIKTQK